MVSAPPMSPGQPKQTTLGKCLATRWMYNLLTSMAISEVLETVPARANSSGRGLDGEGRGERRERQLSVNRRCLQWELRCGKGAGIGGH